MKSARTTGANSALLAALALAGCASIDTEYAAARESWRGASYDQVVMAWGPPTMSGADSHTWLGGCNRTLAFRDGRVVDERWAGEPSHCMRYARRSK